MFLGEGRGEERHLFAGTQRQIPFGPGSNGFGAALLLTILGYTALLVRNGEDGEEAIAWAEVPAGT